MKKINNNAALNTSAALNTVGAECATGTSGATNVISIDAATKSLAIACLTIHSVDTQNKQIYEIAKSILSKKCCLPAEVNKINNLLTPICIHSLHVVDLIPNKKVSQCGIIDRSSALVIFLHKLTSDLTVQKWLTSATQIIVEYQMGQNRKSGDIQTQIIYHFLQYLPATNIHIIGPSLKNKLYFMSDPQSRHSYHISKYDTLYSANKSHTKYMFLKWLEAHKQLNHLRAIKKKNYADIADAFCQAAAWYSIK